MIKDKKSIPINRTIIGEPKHSTSVTAEALIPPQSHARFLTRNPRGTAMNAEIMEAIPPDIEKALRISICEETSGTIKRVIMLRANG